MMSYLSENEAKNLQNGDVMAQFFCIFHALSFDLIFFNQRFPLKLVLEQLVSSLLSPSSKSHS